MNISSILFTVFALALLGNAVGHSMGVLQSWGVVQMQPGSSTGGLLSNLGIPDLGIKAVGLLFAVVMVGGLAATFGFWEGLQWWRPLTMVVSAASLGLFAIWWGTLPAFSEYGAVSFGVVAILAAYFWP